MVRHLFGKDKPVPAVGAPAKELTPVKADPPITLLQRERERLTATLSELHDLQLQEQSKEQECSHIRSNIARLEQHPWFDALYDELRSRDNGHAGTGSATLSTEEFVNKLKEAQDSGLLQK